MDQLLQTVVGLWISVRPIVIRAIPTFVLVLALYFYLKKIIFEPLDRTIDERRKRTLGAIEGAEATLREVEKKAADYEKALQDARSGIYREQEAHRKTLAEEQAAAVAAARDRMKEQAKQVKVSISAEAEAAKTSLALEVERLSEQIAVKLLDGRAH